MNFSEPPARGPVAVDDVKAPQIVPTPRFGGREVAQYEIGKRLAVMAHGGDALQLESKPAHHRVGGRGAGLPNSSVVMGDTSTSTPATWKISRANCNQVAEPEFETW